MAPIIYTRTDPFLKTILAALCLLVTAITAKAQHLNVKEASRAFIHHKGGLLEIKKGNAIEEGDTISLLAGGLLKFQIRSTLAEKCYSIKKPGVYTHDDLPLIAGVIDCRPTEHPVVRKEEGLRKLVKEQHKDPEKEIHPAGIFRTPEDGLGTFMERKVRNVYAICIGISNYRNIKKLSFAHTDAKAFASYIDRTFNRAALNNIYELTDRKIIHDDITDAFSDIWRKANDSDIVFFYFAGHGDLEPKDTNDIKSYQLLLTDCPRYDYSINTEDCISMLELNDQFKRLLDKKVKLVVVLDACHSGELVGGLEGVTSLQYARQVQENEFRILSCSGWELSVEGKQWGGGRGAFSYYLIQGLEGKADGGRKDQKITALELVNYINDATEKDGLRQHPFFQGNTYITLNELPVKKPLTASHAKRNDSLSAASAALPQYPLVSRSLDDDNVPAMPGEAGSVGGQADSRTGTSVAWQALFDKIRSKIATGQLIHPAAENALSLFLNLHNTESAGEQYYQLKNELIHALQQRYTTFFNTEFNSYLKSKVKNPNEEYPPAFDEEQLKFIGQELKAAQRLAEDDNLRSDVIKAHLSFIHALQEVNHLTDRRYEVADYSSYRNALNYLDTAMKLDPYSPYYLFRAGYISLRMNDYQGAEQYFKKFSDKVPNNQFAFNYLGYAYFRQHKTEEAEAAFLQSFANNSQLPANSYNLYMLYSAEGKNDKAMYYKQTYNKLAAKFENDVFNNETK